MDLLPNTKILSDYYGVTYITYNSQRNDNNLEIATSTACIKIKQMIRNLGPRHEIVNNTSDKTKLNTIIGLEKVFDTYDAGEPEILNELSITEGPVRMFLQIASQNIGIKGSLFDQIHDASMRNIEMRILHASEKSKYFSEDRLISIGKNTHRIIESIKYVNNSLEELASNPGTSFRQRTHKLPFIWRLYCFEKKLYFMPYFTTKDATKKSPVLVFAKKSSSLYSTFVDWFDHVWEENAPKKISISDIITPATPAGTALAIDWNDYHVFAIAKRELTRDSDFIRFSGIGGKRFNQTESWYSCAIREGNEETGNAVGNIINATKTYILKADDTLEEINIVSEDYIPHLIIEKRVHTGTGSMGILDDHYYLVSFFATLTKKPVPTNEVAALLFLKEQHLKIMKNRSDVTINELVHNGAIIEEQEENLINRDKFLLPFGIASYFIRQLS